MEQARPRTLEAKKRDSVDLHVLFKDLRERVTEGSEDPDHGEAGTSRSLHHELRAAREDERSLRQRLHRVHDPKGMELLRGLRARISCLEQLLGLREDDL